MKLVAITIIRNGALREALVRAHWNQAELARRSGVSAHTISQLATMRHKIKPEYLQKIQNAFGEIGIYIPIEKLWPEKFKGFGKSIRVEQYKEVDSGHLIQFHENQKMLLEDSDTFNDMRKSVEELEPSLRPLHAHVFDMFLEGNSVPEIAAELKITRGRVDQILNSVRRKVAAAIDGDQISDNQKFLAAIELEVEKAKAAQ